MTGGTLRIGRIFGIEVRLDYSWFIAFALVAWSLVNHYFPSTHSGWPTGIYWAMGAVAALQRCPQYTSHPDRYPGDAHWP